MKAMRFGQPAVTLHEQQAHIRMLLRQRIVYPIYVTPEQWRQVGIDHGRIAA
ncbi:hypothetical protein MnTg04_00290 [bacterium MnTg04]|nr:hypothetical protein MnTg04_00290 [bacterium MnTg04]